MSEANWRELVADPEVRKIVERIARTTPRTGDAYLDDDRESYLWEKAIAAARAHEDRDGFDHHKQWYGHLNARLKHAVHQQRSDTYGSLDPAAPHEAVRRSAESNRLSLETLIEDAGDAILYTAHDDIWWPSNDEPRGDTWPDGRSYFAVYLTRDDPLWTVLAREQYETAVRHARARERADGHAWTVVPGFCSDPGCLRPPYDGCRGMCGGHYERWRSRWGASGATCITDGCDLPVRGRGLCGTHYAAWRRSDPAAPQCAAPACDKPAFVRGLCARHYNQTVRDHLRARAATA